MLFHPCPFVCWLVSQMDYRNATPELGRRTGRRPINFGADPDKETDPEIFI